MFGAGFYIVGESNAGEKLETTVGLMIEAYRASPCRHELLTPD